MSLSPLLNLAKHSPLNFNFAMFGSESKASKDKIANAPKHFHSNSRWNSIWLRYSKKINIAWKYQFHWKNLWDLLSSNSCVNGTRVISRHEKSFTLCTEKSSKYLLIALAVISFSRSLLMPGWTIWKKLDAALNKESREQQNNLW